MAAAAYATVPVRRVWRLDVPIQTILEREHGPVFEPDEIAALTAAFQAALSKLGLGLVEHTDPLRTAVAKAIVELAKDGERDPEKLCAAALRILGR
jgi:hypothetical protein